MELGGREGGRREGGMEAALGVPLALGGGHEVAAVTWCWWQVAPWPWSSGDGFVEHHRFLGWFLSVFWDDFFPLSEMASLHFLG